MTRKKKVNNDYDILSGREKAAWRLPREITVSRWADENRMLDPKTSAEPGQWRTERTPYLREIMNAFNDPFVEEITVMASTQIGKTESLYNMIGYVIDQDPGPVLLVMPRETDARSVSYHRVIPMLQLSPALSTHLTDASDDITKLEYNLDHMIVYFAGSNSPAALAQRPVRYLFFDEVDKFPKFSGKEADPIKLAQERTRTFWNRKIVKSSSPTTRQGYICREYERSDRRRYYVPCPHCGEYQILVFSQIKWPKEERNAEKIKNERLAWYECRCCNKKILDKRKTKMLEKGLWAPEDTEITPDGNIKGEIPEYKHRGFWISALYSSWLTFSEIAAEFLKSENYPELLMNFVNSWLAEIWEEKLEETKPAHLKALVDNYEEGILPRGILVLTAGVDVQLDHFYIAIRGWGYGEESWLVRACKVESWEDVIAVALKTDYPYIDGKEVLSVRLTCVDSGYRVNEVYEVGRKYKDIVRVTKGRDSFPGGEMYRVNYIDRNSRGKPIPGGLGLWHLNTSYYKDKISRMVHSDPGDPSQWHLFKDVQETYIKQFCAEQKIQMRDRKTGRVYEVWKRVTGGAPNHYLDCEVGAAAAADMLRVSAMRPEGENLVYRVRKRGTFIQKPRHGWVRRGSGKWIKRG